MIACPKCKSDNVKIERRPDGDSVCCDCGYKDKTAKFKLAQSPNKLNPPKGRVFLALTKQYPWTTICHWNGVDERFNYVNLQAGIYEGKQNDFYFENESCKEEDILAWMEMPQMNFIVGR